MAGLETVIAKVIVIFLTFSFTSVIDSYKILMIPLAGKSHIFPMLSIAEKLASRGNNNVTVLFPRNHPLNSTISNRHGLHAEFYDDGTRDHDKATDELFGDVMEKEISLVKLFMEGTKRCRELSRHVLNDNDQLFDKLDQVGFDVAIVDGILGLHFLYLIPHRLRIPVITYSDEPKLSLVRVPWLPSIVPSMLTSLNDRMSFFERLQNAAIVAALMLFDPMANTIPEETLDRYRQYGEFNQLEDLVKRSVLWLYPRDPVLDYPTPTMPNLISVGGLSVKLSTAELSADLKMFVDSAPRGTIVVSFGSIASNFPLALTKKFIEVFRQLDGINVVWKWRKNDKNSDSSLEFPANVRTYEWIPQSDLLANSNVKLFITHCGNSGQYEAFYRAVPMIGFPLFGDQKYNARRMTSKGFGIAMNIYSFTSDELLANVKKVLADDGSFKARISKASEIYRSSPMSPLDTASFWIEHVCKYGGDHLRSGGSDLPLYAYFMLDIAFFALLVVGLLIYCVVLMLRVVSRKLFANSIWQQSEKIKAS